MVVVSFIMQWR